jgi:hypothetical protein|tara:strand:- start:205 stop:531 length:327 start_codon:yes stop_codon:yes gene_type:complete
MSDWMETIRKENSPLLEKLDPKMKKRVKKTLQAAQPTEFFGQDFTKLGNLLETVKSVGVEKSENKKLEAMEEKNLEIVASAAELRKDYETLYNQIRSMIYPKKKGDLK